MYPRYPGHAANIANATFGARKQRSILMMQSQQHPNPNSLLSSSQQFQYQQQQYCDTMIKELNSVSLHNSHKILYNSSSWSRYRARFKFQYVLNIKQLLRIPQVSSDIHSLLAFQSLNPKNTINEAKINCNATHKALHTTPIPILLNESFSILLCGELNVIVKTVSDLLQKHGVDICFKPEKCKWIGAAYVCNREISLRVFLYNASSTVISNGNESDCLTKNHYMLEFQRREGSAMDFHNLYQEIYQDLLNTDFIVDCDTQHRNQKHQQLERKPSKSFAPPPFPQCFYTNTVSSSASVNDIRAHSTQAISDELKAEDFASLIALTQSKYIDTQRESLRTAANMVSLDVEKRRVLGSSSDLLETLVDNLISTDAEVCRLSCSALESFSKEADIVTKLARFGLMLRVCQILASPRVTVCSKSCKAKSTREGFSRETRRLASRIAFNMVTHIPDILHKVSGSQVLFRSLGSSEDEDKVVKDIALSCIRMSKMHLSELF